MQTNVTPLSTRPVRNVKAYKLLVEFTDGAVGEWLCIGRDEGYDLLRTLSFVRGFEFIPLEGANDGQASQADQTRV